MDWKRIGIKAGEWAKKYRYILAIVAVGLLLLCIPQRSSQTDTAGSAAQDVSQSVYSNAASELEEILSQVKGVGKVRVLLTVSQGQKTLYQEDSDISQNESGSTVRTETVIITDSDRADQPLISQILPPTYLGAIVVCQGADQAYVKIAVLDAVSKATGLSAAQISVIKMK